MNLTTALLIVVSVCMTAGSQILLKMGMSTPSVQTALAAGGFSIPTLLAIATSFQVILGLAAFALNAMIWLFVLARIDVSQAYPFAALSIALTVAAGALLLGESVSAVRISGIALIAVGVVFVGLS